eukprot:CAMPEP_0176420266 /NCGR_PEP_ID=MMETSP0127-20121128/8512_1 /TAXON_ID=938130 /ORGANISM="Platyophrya macrostoma, Strain WH" /LENGTH=239 /DNA_ID=CAMNT_0017800845 /DNA_START=50 /DNA_END=769 /DNA_ORIENTATION=-
MSFRFTNQLIGVMKHRILLEQGRRQLLQRVFTGICNGVTVKYSAYGRVISIDVSPEAEVAFTLPNGQGIDNAAICAAVQSAVFLANRQLVEAKEEAYRHSITHKNDELKAVNDFQMWFAQSATSLSPKPREMLSHDTSVESIKGIRRDLPDAPMTIADVHAALKPGLVYLEDPKLMVSEQKKEMAEDEREFWRRVELIRKGQIGTIGSSEKRKYKDSDVSGGSTAADTAAEKVVLKFIQ